jgi:hypothetical protein
MTDAFTVIAIVAACLGLAWFVSGRIAKRKRKNGHND